MAEETEKRLTQNLWERYGFSGDPYETNPLPVIFEEQDTLSVLNAYIPRDGVFSPGSVMTNFLKNPNGGRIIVEGQPGVGKTTFVNFHRYEWEFLAQTPLLSPVSHISVQKHWEEEDFLLSLISSLSSRIRLEDRVDFSKHELLQEISSITGLSRDKNGGLGISANIAGYGAGLQTSGSSIKVGKITSIHLKEYLTKLIELVQVELGFSGVIFHLDNLELLTNESDNRLVDFFEEIRDSLQEPNVYFIFVGYVGMFQNTILASQRVKSIFFDKPIVIDPLSLDQVRKILAKRYEILSNRTKWIPPVEEDVITFLYETFEGKIRNIMNSVTSLISHLPDSYADTLKLDEARDLLKHIIDGEVNMLLTKTEVVVFTEAAQLKRFTPTALVRETGKSRQLIQKHLKKFLQNRLIYYGEKVGRSQYYEVNPRYYVFGIE